MFTGAHANAGLSCRRAEPLHRPAFAAPSCQPCYEGVKAGRLRPLTFEKPYRGRFCLRRSFTEDNWVRETVGRLDGVTPSGERGCFAYTSGSAEAVGNMLNEVEWTVLKP